VAFALAKSALDELGKALAESGCVEPVAALCKRTAPLVADEELREAVASGDEGRLRLTADSQRLMVGKQWPVFLDVLFYVSVLELFFGHTVTLDDVCGAD
jgi:hypothetical protein